MDIKERLRLSGKKVTPERITLYTQMQNMHVFESKDLIAHFPEIGRASIFRSIKLFCEIGALRKIQTGITGESYEVECCSKCHHEHMSCQSCGEIISFTSEKICNKLYIEAQKLGFHINTHSINIIGTCKNCISS